MYAFTQVVRNLTLSLYTLKRISGINAFSDSFTPKNILSGVSTVWDVLTKVFKSPYLHNRKEIIGSFGMSCSSMSGRNSISHKTSTENGENLQKKNIEEENAKIVYSLHHVIL